MSKWIIPVILAFAMLAFFQTLPVMAQISDTINKGLGVTEEMLSNTIVDNVPIQNAQGLTHDGFNVLRNAYVFFKSLHHLIVDFLKAILINENDSEEKAKQVATFIEIAGIITMVVAGLQLLKGTWRHFFIIIIIVLMLLVFASVLDNFVSLNW